ncbi:glycosyltransferase family 2 protein [Vibrio astriarenae]
MPIARLAGKLPTEMKKKLKSHSFILKFYTWLLSFSRKDYRDWQNEKEPLMWSPVSNQQSLTFSIVVPVYNPPVDFLKECVESVINQTYRNWELILVDDASSCSEVKSYLSDLVEQVADTRVTVIFSESNEHISLTTNKGIAQASGDYLVFLDHDDTLAPQALNELSVKFQAEPQLKWVYSDEDLMTEKGKRVLPHFKSQWNPYLLHAHNYITHLCAYQRDLVNAVGGLRQGFEGAQDYDLALRVSQQLSAKEIGHIAKILYHWRIHDNSTASSSDAKPYTHKAGKLALEQHLESIGVSAKVEDGFQNNFYKVNYLHTSWPKASIIIPTRDNREILQACVESVLNKTVYPDFELLIMDNQSQEESAKRYLQEIDRYDNVRVVGHDKPFNYSEINNTAVSYAKGEVVVLLNNDTEVISPEWLTELVGLAMQPDVGCVGAKLLYADNTIQHAGVILGLGGYAAHSHRCSPNYANGYFNRPNLNQVLSAVTGACLAIRKETYMRVGGLDEAFQVAYNDVDFCLRVQESGFNNVYCPHAVLYHHESKTRGDDQQDTTKMARFDQEKALLLERWQSKVNDDPYYNPNLTRSREDFSINIEG